MCMGNPMVSKARRFQTRKRFCPSICREATFAASLYCAAFDLIHVVCSSGESEYAGGKGGVVADEHYDGAKDSKSFTENDK